MLSTFPIRLRGSRLFRDVTTTYAGYLANAILGFIAMTLMTKPLGPGAFGVASLANLFMAIIASLGEPGLGTALVRLAAQPGMTAQSVDELVVAAIQLKLVVVAAVCGLAYAMMP